MLFCTKDRVAAAFCTALASLALASSAHADGMVGSLKDEPVVRQGYIWDGLYVAAGVGVGRFGHNVGVDTSSPRPSCGRWCEDGDQFSVMSLPVIGSGHLKFGDDSWEGFGTLQIGYDRLIHDRILIGAFADIDFYPDANHSFENRPRFGGQTLNTLMTMPSGPQINGHLDLEHVWSVGGRLGVLVTPCVLLYGVGGYTEASFDGEVNVGLGGGVFNLAPNGPPPQQSLKLSDELHGWFAGGGGEVKLDEHLSLKLEYRYSKFSGEAVSSGGSFNTSMTARATPAPTTRAEFDTEIHSVRAALVFKLGEPERHEEALALK